MSLTLHTIYKEHTMVRFGTQPSEICPEIPALHLVVPWGKHFASVVLLQPRDIPYCKRKVIYHKSYSTKKSLHDKSFI